MRRLINAVAQVFLDKGYTGLGVNKLARIAGVYRKLTYRYFQSFDGLVEAYICETDYWMQISDQLSQLPVPKDMLEIKHMLAGMLKNQFVLSGTQRMQELILGDLLAIMFLR